MHQPPLLSLLFSVRRTFHWLARIGSSFGAALVWPIEAAFRFAAHKLFAAAEWAERVDSNFIALFRGITWPVRLAGRALGTAASWLMPESLIRAGAAFVQRTFARLVRLGDALNLDVAVLWLVWLLRPVWYPLAAIGGFLAAWAATRPRKVLWWGLPPLVLVLPLVLGAGWNAMWGKAALAKRYRAAVSEALQEKDYARAQLFERKLAQLGVDTKLSEFNTAQALAREGDLAEAYRRMQRLAPADAPGYPPAHYWIIERLLTNKLDLPPAEAHRLLGHHLEHLAALGIRGPHYDLLKGYWLAGANRLEEAVAILKPLVHSEPVAAMERFRLNLALRRPAEARSDALAIRRHMQRAREDSASLTSHEYQWWSAAEEFLGDRSAARAVLHQWTSIDPHNERARNSLAALSLAGLDESLFASETPPEVRAQLIREVFRADAVSDDIKRRVAVLYQQKDARPELRALFDELAEDAKLPAPLAETLGTAAAVHGEWQRARVWLEQAVAADSSSATGWNNLACVLLQQGGQSLEPALAASNMALELSPADFRYRETRGQILLRLERWQEAVHDLEYALNGMPDLPVIHQSLSTAYDALGNKQLAAVHRQHAQ